MTITEIYETAEKLKEDASYLIKMVNEVASRLEKQNDTPDVWAEGMHQAAAQFQNLRQTVEDWKRREMKNKLTEAMANGQLSDEEMLELDRKSQRIRG